MPLGISVVGGMLVSTFLTLILVPAVWLLFARLVPERKDAEQDLDQAVETVAG
jgi:Cu/Ag efflux pump CusA